MPIVKCSASKATPAKGINYIMDPEKVIAKGHQGFVTQDPKKMQRFAKVFVTNITKDENTYMCTTQKGEELWAHHVVCDCTIEGVETEKQTYRIFSYQEYADVMSKGYYLIPEEDE